MKLIAQYFLGTVFRPGRTLRKLKEDPRALRRGFNAVFGAGILISLTAAGLAFSGAVPMAPVALPVDPDNYFFCEMIFALPFIVFIWGLMSVIIHFFGRGGRRGGSLRKTMSLSAFALSGPLILLWIPQIIIAVFYGLGMGQQEMVDILSEPGQWQSMFLAVCGLAFVWSLILVSMAVAISQNIRWGKGLFLGAIAESVIVVAVVLFLR